MTDATTVLVITDPETGEVLRVVVPDNDDATRNGNIPQRR